MGVSNLPTVKENSLPDKIKDYLSTRNGKAKAFATLTALGIAGITTSFVLPVGIASSLIAFPSLVSLSYGGLKLVKNTIFASYKDLAFVIKSKKDSIKISQDTSRLDLMGKLVGKSKTEKLSFMQLQAIVGLSKIESLPAEFQNKRIETDTHGIVISTFEKLNKIGLVKNLSVTPKINMLGKQRESRHTLEKIFVGNFNPKDLFTKKETISNVSFQIGNKIDINNPDLRKAFPSIFGKEGSKTHIGLLAKYGWSILENTDGSLSIDYGAKQKTKEESLNDSLKIDKRKEFSAFLKKNAPTAEQQSEVSKYFLENSRETNKKPNTFIEKD